MLSWETARQKEFARRASLKWVRFLSPQPPALLGFDRFANYRDEDEAFDQDHTTGNGKKAF
jgi:hypothetical protein